MFTPLSARLFFRLCLALFYWAGPVPSAAAPAAPGVPSRGASGMPDNVDRLIRETYASASITGIHPAYRFFSDTTIDLHGGYEWDLQHAQNTTPDLSPSYSRAFSSAGIDIRADSVNWFLSELKNRAAEIARHKLGKSSRVPTLSHGRNGSRMKIMNPKETSGRWLRIRRTNVADRDVIGWSTVGMAPRTEQLTLCFIGLLWMAPSILRHRGVLGGKDTGRRRNLPAGIYRID